MDLSHQPRKELIVNEILVMKESQHPNIVNFLESYLVKNTELWVVMEYMEGGALTDIIENNTLEEDQISSICYEVSILDGLWIGRLITAARPAKGYVTFIVNPSFTATSNRTMFSWTQRVASRSVRIEPRLVWTHP